MSEFIERAKFSCALGGALTTIAGIPKVVPIVHAAGGCASALSGTYNLASGYRGTGYCGGTMIPTSNIAENNIVFGGEDRLKEQIEETVKALEADLYFVVTGCQVEIIGDNAVGVAKRYRNQKVVGASTPGFLGNSFKGYDAVLKTLITDVIEKSEEKEEKTVNLLGIIPGHDVFYRGNIDEIHRLLGLLGIKVNSFFGTEESIEKIKTYGKASLNILFSTEAGLEPAKLLESEHDIPYILQDIPIGPSATKAFLIYIGKLFQIEDEKIQNVIEEENRRYYSFLERIVDIYSDIDFQRYVIVAADSYYAYSLSRFLANDLGWIVHLISINDIENELNQHLYSKKFEDIHAKVKPHIIYKQNAGEIIKEVRKTIPYNHNQKYYDALSPSFVVGSGIEKELAEKLGAGFLSVAFPVSNRVVLNKGYTGYRGGLTLIEDLLSQLVSAR